MEILKFIAAGVVIMIVFIIFMEKTFTRRDSSSEDTSENHIKKNEKSEKAEPAADEKNIENDDTASG